MWNLAILSGSLDKPIFFKKKKTQKFQISMVAFMLAILVSLDSVILK